MQGNDRHRTTTAILIKPHALGINIIKDSHGAQDSYFLAYVALYICLAVT